MTRGLDFRSILACLLLLVCAAAQAQSTRGAASLQEQAGEPRPFTTSHALVVGIDGYNAGWKPLTKAIEDARAVAAALKDSGFQDVELKLDLDSVGLERAMKDFIYRKGADPDARLLIWFAGHGHTIGGEGYLVPRDAPEPGDTPASEAAFQSMAMPLVSFGRYMNEVKARHVITIFDSCFSGSVFNASRSSVPASVLKSSGQLARQFIASGSAGEEALDDGRFREKFIAALAGQARGALTDDGYLTGSRLGAYLAEQISKLTDGRQNPIYSTSNVVGFDRGDFVFPLRFPTSGAVIDVPPAMTPPLVGPGAETAPPELRVEAVEWQQGDPDVGNLADKLARQLVEYFDGNNIYVSSTLTGREPVRAPTHFLHSRLNDDGDAIEFDVELKDRGGERIASATFAGKKAFYKEYYKVLPQTVRYMLDVSLRTLDPVSSANRPTESGEAYALFLAARQRASRKQFDKAAELIKQAIEVDDSFAAAYAALAELSLRLGEAQSVHDDYTKQALAIDPDFPRLSVFDEKQLGDPVPALRQAAAGASWQQIAKGLEFRRIETPDYGTSIFAWRYDQAKIGLRLVKSLTSQGETAADMRQRGKGILAINAGFFDLDMKSRLSPVGLIVVDGRELNRFDAMKAKNPLSGLLFSKDGSLGIMWSRDYTPDMTFDAAIQTGPLLVDPGGKHGINQNSYDRQNRSAVCLDANGQPIILQVSGGLSLYEFAEILSLPEADGGFGCERAINLDGGPSSQVSVLADGVSLEVPGLWKISSSLVLSER